MLEFYEREILPKKNDRLIAARPREGAHEAIEAVLNRGMRIALLTNPSFSRACIECRMAGATWLDMPFELVTTWENSTRCKPCSGYYLEALGKLGLAPEETLMVGNDPKRDFPSPAIAQDRLRGQRQPAARPLVRQHGGLRKALTRSKSSSARATDAWSLHPNTPQERHRTQTKTNIALRAECRK